MTTDGENAVDLSAGAPTDSAGRLAADREGAAAARFEAPRRLRHLPMRPGIGDDRLRGQLK
ncbi:hypothetical protein GCM10023193_08480 [Planotetraspora kaengkrachanensis]|uniref:Uncharacterized protein n=1 Tax=Planotetraspora kaengkrachanensis TaxID=575193 RepID=A0A8J3M2A7_9ACTN|nr:hypothetical protein Pka01_08330 [Planotetraspora kaengkrachanensis]